MHLVLRLRGGMMHASSGGIGLRADIRKRFNIPDSEDECRKLKGYALVNAWRAQLEDKPVFAKVHLPGRDEPVRVEVDPGMTLEGLRDAAVEVARGEDEDDDEDEDEE